MSKASDSHWAAFPTNRWKKELHVPILKDKPSYKKKLIKGNDAFEVWRRRCLERDGYRCVDCGKKHSRWVTITVHHVKPISIIAKTGEYPFDDDNGVSLCRKCHDRREAKAKLDFSKKMSLPHANLDEKETKLHNEPTHQKEKGATP